MSNIKQPIITRIGNRHGTRAITRLGTSVITILGTTVITIQLFGVTDMPHHQLNFKSYLV